MPSLHLVKIVAIAICISIAPATSFGDVYKWVDANGNTVYGNKPPKNADLRKITGNISSFTSVKVESFKYDPSLITPEQAKSKTVIMYSTSWCGYCKKAARHFRRKNIPFKEYDIEKSKSAAKAYRKLNGRGVPLILVGKKRMTGFDANRFDKLYKGKS